MRRARTSLLLGSLLVASATSAPARQQALRSPDVPFEPTPMHVVEEMLRLAGVGRGDVVYDLGCGDGRIVITAARQFGARGVGIDIDPQRIKESVANARAAGVQDRVTFRNEDLFEAEIAKATVVTLFLWPEVNLKLRPKLWRDLRRGTRVVSYYWTMGDWAPEKQIEVDGHGIYLWTIPPRRPPGSVPPARLQRHTLLAGLKDRVTAARRSPAAGTAARPSRISTSGCLERGRPSTATTCR